jgi:Fe-S-cluster-containing hydrogenase component 2/predicted transcriptional regulator
MTDNVYFDLREQLDQYAGGFPSTRSGVEMEILEMLFSPEEAEMFLSLSVAPETPEALAQRLGREPNEIAALLERMTDKGLIFRSKKAATFRYGAVPFVPGSYDFQVKDMDRAFAELMERYFAEGLSEQAIAPHPPLRPIPVNKSIDHKWPVMPHDDVKAIISCKEKISVARCICKVQQELLNKGCGKPVEACFQFGSNAQYYVDKGMARFITHEDAFEILDRCEEAGLVPQPVIGEDSGAMCNCCGDCCEILRSIKLDPKPAERVFSNYYATVAPETCSACETCADRCQMEAIKAGANGVAEVDRDRCIGCGLCVTTCPTQAVSLELKAEPDRREPPASTRQFFMQLASVRGKSLIPMAIAKKAQT